MANLTLEPSHPRTLTPSHPLTLSASSTIFIVQSDIFFPSNESQHPSAGPSVADTYKTNTTGQAL